MSRTASIKAKWARVADTYKRYGAKATLQAMINMVGGRFFNLKISTIVWLNRSSVEAPTDIPSDTELRFLTAEEVVKFADDPENKIRIEYVRRALAGTDRCYAALVDGRLASYGWYSIQQNISMDDHGLFMRGPANAAFMHNGFTHPDFRGRRLHGVGMASALHELAKEGVEAFLSDVDWANHASLRSCERLGYEFLGNLYVYGISRWHGARYPKPAMRRGVEFFREAVPVPDQPASANLNRTSASADTLSTSRELAHSGA